MMSFTKSNLVESLPDIEIEDEGSSSTSIVLQLSECGLRLDKALANLLTQYSRSRIQQWIEMGWVTVDGKPGNSKMITYGDETVVVVPQQAPQEHAFIAEDIPLFVIHEDNAIVVINKQAGLVTHPAAGNWSGTLLNGLLFHWPFLSALPRAGIVHRLDKDTSGLIVVAKTIEAQTDLVRQLQLRSVKRHYLALVWGVPPLSGTINQAMARHRRDRIKMAVSDSALAKPAITHYQRLASGFYNQHAVSLMLCQLETGRTHQIRVHMQSLGFPLVGDPLYGKPHLAHVFARQALHAFRLGLQHPGQHQMCQWSIPLPADFAALLDSVGILMPEEIS